MVQIIRSKKMRSTKFDPMIRAWQWDVIRLFGSCYCYDDIFIICPSFKRFKILTKQCQSQFRTNSFQNLLKSKHCLLSVSEGCDINLDNHNVFVWKIQSIPVNHQEKKIDRYIIKCIWPSKVNCLVQIFIWFSIAHYSILLDIALNFLIISTLDQWKLVLNKYWCLWVNRCMTVKSQTGLPTQGLCHTVPALSSLSYWDPKCWLTFTHLLTLWHWWHHSTAMYE